MIGSTLSHYQIESELGRGGMGIVYKAQDTKLKRTVALKLLPASALASEDDRARFYREATAAAQLQHANIATIYGIDEAVPESGGEAQPFIAMEFVDGPTLEDKLKLGLFSLPEALEMCAQVAQALELAHENGIVHRDIKSANVMISAKGQAKVLDFGLAKTAQSTMLTRVGSTMGTIAYMSPEQARGEEVDHRTDLWAVGVMLYELLTGRHPFSGDYEQAIVYSILNEDPAPMTSLRAGVPMSLDWIVGKLLAKNADERYQSATDLLVDLKTADLKQAGLSRTTTMSTASMSAAPSAATAASAPVAPRSTNIWTILVPVLIAGLAIGWGVTRALAPPPHEPAVRYYNQSYPGLNDSRFPAISESGRYLAVVGQDSLAPEHRLQIHDLQTDIVVTVAKSDLASWPVFSPDESKIAFNSAGILKMAGIQGGEPVEVAPAFPDMMVWDNQGVLYFVTPGSEMRMVSSTGKVESFMPADTAIVGFYPMAILADGKTMIVQHNENDGASSGWTLDMETGQLVTILERDLWYVRYVESGHLVVQSGSGGRLSAYPLSKSEDEIAGFPQAIRPQVNSWGWFATKSGHLVSFGDRAGSQLEMVSDEDGTGEFTRLLPDRLDYEEFQFSPSGRFLAAEINGYQNGSDQLLMFDLRTGLPTRQLTFEGASYEPTWSPDEKRIAFARIRNGTQQIGILTIDGTNPIEWLHETSSTSGDPDWSSSGEFIVFDRSGTGGQNDIWKYSFADSTESVLISAEGNQQYARVSHNNRYVAYESTENRSTEVWVYDIETGAKKVVGQNGGFRPAWGPNDEKLYFRSAAALYSVDVSTADGFTVLGQPVLEVEVGNQFYFDVSDDGSIAIAKNVSVASTDIEIIMNWAKTLDSPE